MNPEQTLSVIETKLENLKMSRRKLAILAGIPPSTLQTAFDKKRELSHENLLKISDVLNIPLEELTDLPDDWKNIRINYQRNYTISDIDLSDADYLSPQVIAYRDSLIDKLDKQISSLDVDQLSLISTIIDGIIKVSNAKRKTGRTRASYKRGDEKEIMEDDNSDE